MIRHGSGGQTQGYRNKGGRLFRCDNPGEQTTLANYYIKPGETSALFFSWVFQQGPWVLQINGG